MAIVTAIKKQRNGKRLNVYLDGKFGFGIDLDNFVKFGLKVEQELSEEEISEIAHEAEFSKYLEKLLRFAMVRPRSEKEIRDWFYRKKVHESMQDALIEKLIKYDLVGDRQFAQWWVEQRKRFRPRSMTQLVSELRGKGIDKNIITEVLMDVEVDETQIAKDLLKKNKKKWEKYEKEERKRKMSEYLGRKGFSWEVIKEATEVD